MSLKYINNTELEGRTKETFTEIDKFCIHSIVLILSLKKMILYVVFTKDFMIIPPSPKKLYGQNYFPSAWLSILKNMCHGLAKQSNTG